MAPTESSGLASRRPGLEKVRELVQRFDGLPSDQRAQVGELELRDTYIRPMFEALGWSAEPVTALGGETPDRDVELWYSDLSVPVEVRRRDGKTYYVVTDMDAWKQGVGRLLTEVQRIKSEGDRPGAEELMERYAIRIDPKLRDEVVARFDRLNLPSYTGFVMPKLTPVTDRAGRITDVRISYPMDLETQMLEWSGRR